MKLYVGNLPFQFSDAELRGLFVAFDHIKSATVVIDKHTGRSKGFGFVEFSNKSEALAAIAFLNGRIREGRTLQVNEAQAIAGEGSGARMKSRSGPGRDAEKKSPPRPPPKPGKASRAPANQSRVPKIEGGKGLVAKAPASKPRPAKPRPRQARPGKGQAAPGSSARKPGPRKHRDD